jgi:hypothetical protein
MPFKDSKKAKEYKRKWNAEFYKRNAKAEYKRVKARRDELRAWLNEYKATLSCEKCGESHPACLDFHHKDSKTKDFSLGVIRGQGYGKERLLKEIKKCMVICANCHRKIHFGAGSK